MTEQDKVRRKRVAGALVRMNGVFEALAALLLEAHLAQKELRYLAQESAPPGTRE